MFHPSLMQRGGAQRAVPPAGEPPPPSSTLLHLGPSIHPSIPHSQTPSSFFCHLNPGCLQSPELASFPLHLLHQPPPSSSPLPPPLVSRLLLTSAVMNLLCGGTGKALRFIFHTRFWPQSSPVYHHVRACVRACVRAAPLSAATTHDFVSGL